MADRGDHEPRTRAELAADLAFVAVSAAGGLMLLVTRLGAPGAGWISGPADLAFAVDAAMGTAACGLLWFRRRWPTPVALAMVVPLVLSRSAQVAIVVSVYNVSLRRPPRTALIVAALHQVAFIGFSLLWTKPYPLWGPLLLMLAYQIAAVALGMYARARRQLIASLHERVEHAEATQKLLATRARQAERARIATEMHDVLGHRVSLMALQAGALEIRPDLPADEVRATAGLIRTTARQALTELRDVIGVLRDGDAPGEPGAPQAPRAPQPTLSDVVRLVSEYRQAGLEVRLDMRVATPEAVPGTLGRDTYRIVREALTNVSKHASGMTVTVSVSGQAGEGLQVMVRNRMLAPPLPQGPPPPQGQAALAGTGSGLAALAERVAVAGGSLRHGPGPDGDFVLAAALRWDQ